MIDWFDKNHDMCEKSKRYFKAIPVIDGSIKEELQSTQTYLSSMYSHATCVKREPLNNLNLFILKHRLYDYNYLLDYL